MRSKAFRPAPVTTPTTDKKAFLAACWRGDTVAVTKAIRGGIDPNFSLGGIHKPLVYALQNGQDEILKILLENGASPNTQVEADPILHHAFAAPSRDAVEMLLAHGADPTQLDGSGMNTIVDAAVIGGDDVLVNLAIRLMQEEGGMDLRSARNTIANFLAATPDRRAGRQTSHKLGTAVDRRVIRVSPDHGLAAA